MNERRETAERIYELQAKFKLAKHLVNASGQDRELVQELEDLDNLLRGLGLAVLKSRDPIDLEATFEVLEKSLGTIVHSLPEPTPNSSKTPLLDALGQSKLPTLDDEYCRMSSEALALANHLNENHDGMSDAEFFTVMGRIKELQTQMRVKQQE